MNSKGQFSIIAALLVAVVLVGTVITTYATLRQSTSQEQPQVLTAIDETNLALDKILGFTVGYYGSVLQVTGDSEYAKNNLTIPYLRASLGNLSDIKPEWGAVFTLVSLDLNANWFTNTSFSSGEAVVDYSLPGLGISGMNYNTSCRLDVQVSNSSSLNQACLSVLKDGSEPVINLGRGSFKFYRYLHPNASWGFEEPSGELTAFANGTYLIGIPSGMGIDASDYMVQVTDTRGIMVAAASFSRITAGFMWNTTTALPAADYIDTNTTDVDSSPNKGTQSNFTAQRYGPDGILDTLTEANSPYTWAYSQDYVDANNTDVDYTTSIGTQVNFTAQGYSDGVYDTLIEANINPSGSIAKVGADTSGSGNSLALSFSHTLVAGTNRLVVVCVGIENGNTIDVSGVTYGGMAMTKATDALTGTSGHRYLVELWYILEANLPANGARTVSITCSGTASSLEINGYCSEYSGVNQTAPEATDSDFVNSDIRTITSTISPSTGAYAISAVGCGNRGSYTHGSPQVEVRDFADASSQFAVAELRGADGQTYLNSTFSSTVNRQARVVASFRPYAGATNYRLDIEEQFTSATFNSECEYLCVKTGTLNGESLQLQVWNGSWNTLSAGLSASTWNNFSISSYLTSSTLYVRFLDGTQANDTSQSSWQIDSVLLRTYNETNYRLEIEEQWTNADYAYPRQDLCIKAGTLGSETLVIDVWHGGAWVLNVAELTGLVDGWKNVSITPYINSSTFTIRFRDANNSSDPIPDSWDIDAVLLNPQPDIDTLLKSIDHVMTVELLQNGTMRWLGQNLQLTTDGKPVPPIPVKAIHVNQTINGVEQEVPFQVEDWASEYRIPLGLTNNATVFGNKQMIVFLIDVNVSKVTIWWNGSDTATQTSLAYTNRYFTANTNAKTVSNGRIMMQFYQSGFKVNTTVDTANFTASFMRVNTKEDITDPELAFTIISGVVRAIVHGEPEWSGGITSCSNVYASTVFTLPANATYYTYQLRLIFINSTDRPRTITDLCPIKLSTTLNPVTIQTENGTVNTAPIVANGTGIFKNYDLGGAWTAHHWSQFNSTTGTGAGIIFTNASNQLLYAFDSIASATTGSLNVSTTARTIEFSPVTPTLGQVSEFGTTYSITWYGAVAAFNSTTTPVYTLQGTAPSGLWLLVEYQPKVTVTSES